MTLEEMKRRKAELGLTNEMLAKASGIPASTIQKIFSGTTAAPRRMTLEALWKALTPDGMLKETSLQYGSAVQELPETQDTRHTIEDYYALPDEQRVELIDGIFYDMSAPSMVHQLILGTLFVLFDRCAEKHGGTCDVYMAPCDVRLDMDNYTMVQPDILVICRDYDAAAIRFEGAPDLCVEILSPSTRSKDMFLKLYKYQNAGVREYWVVDPKYRTVTVHHFTEDYSPKKYSFDDSIPVEISGGECVIDFSVIHERLKKRGF